MKKAEFEEKEQRIKKLEGMKRELEATWEVQAYKAYLALSGEDKKRLNEMWDQYYQDVRNTRQYKRYRAIAKAIEEGRLGDARRYLAVDIPEELAKPSEHDFEVVKRKPKVLSYVNVISNLSQLQPEYEDIEKAREVFGI